MWCLYKLLFVISILSYCSCFVVEKREISTNKYQDSRNKDEKLQKPDENLRIFMKRHLKNNIPDRNQNSTSPFIQNATEAININSLDIENSHLSGKSNNSSKSRIDKKYENFAKSVKIKPAIVITPPAQTTPSGPRTKCLHKKVQEMQTPEPQYDDDENDPTSDKSSSPSEETLPDGSKGLVEECAYGITACYSLWILDSHNNSVTLGQGCWKTSLRSSDDCLPEKCHGEANDKHQYFCCCRTDHCNHYMEAGSPSVVEKHSGHDQGWDVTVASIVAVAAVILIASSVFIVRCAAKARAKIDNEENEDRNTSTGDDISSGLCVDNLTLIEHIGTGKFGSVWRGSLGPKPVAVKIYKAKHHMQHEVDIYTLPFMTHTNLLHLFGSESARISTGRHVAVLELCATSLQARLMAEKVSWAEFVDIGQGISTGLAHLHTPISHNGLVKPSVVHRDISSKNVLLDTSGRAKLADLGLAMPLYANCPLSGGVSEAGTWRYLSPEALEGAVDLCAPRAALSAVDVYALGLLLWEVLSRVYGEYEPPFAHVSDQNALLTLVSRGKARPALPRGNSPGLRLARDTCGDCWDHDADARLTAVCVVERFNEIRQLMQPHTQLVKDDNLHGNSAEGATPAQEIDKNSNCVQNSNESHPYDVYNQPHIGRNACIVRNTHTNDSTENDSIELIEKSLKDSPVNEMETQPNFNANNCLSVARNQRKNPYTQPDFTDEIRTYVRPIDFVPNDVSSINRVKDTNLIHDRVVKKNWAFKDLFKRRNIEDNHDLRPANLNLNADTYNFENPCTLSPPNKTLSPNMLPVKNEVKRKQIYAVIVPKGTYDMQNKDSASSLNKSGCSSDYDKKNEMFTNSSASSRASLENVELKYIKKDEFSFEHSDCSSTSDEEHLMLLNENGRSKIVMKNGYKNIENSNDLAEKENLINTLTNDNPVYYAQFPGKIAEIKRQRSLEQVSEIFTSSGLTGKLQNPANRVKTPGDLPVAVRQARRDKVIQQQNVDINRLSLHDDCVLIGNNL